MYCAIKSNSMSCIVLCYGLLSSVTLVSNGFGLCVRVSFGALHCQTALHLNRSTKLDLTTEPPLLGRRCYVPFFFSSFFRLVSNYCLYKVRKFYFILLCNESDCIITLHFVTSPMQVKSSDFS